MCAPAACAHVGVCRFMMLYMWLSHMCIRDVHNDGSFRDGVSDVVCLSLHVYVYVLCVCFVCFVCFVCCIVLLHVRVFVHLHLPVLLVPVHVHACRLRSSLSEIASSIIL